MLIIIKKNIFQRQLNSYQTSTMLSHSTWKCLLFNYLHIIGRKPKKSQMRNNNWQCILINGFKNICRASLILLTFRIILTLTEINKTN